MRFGIYIEVAWDARYKRWWHRLLGEDRGRIVYRVKQEGKPGAAGPYTSRRKAQRIADVWEAEHQRLQDRDYLTEEE